MNEIKKYDRVVFTKNHKPEHKLTDEFVCMEEPDNGEVLLRCIEVGTNERVLATDVTNLAHATVDTSIFARPFQFRDLVLMPSKFESVKSREGNFMEYKGDGAWVDFSSSGGIGIEIVDIKNLILIKKAPMRTRLRETINFYEMASMFKSLKYPDNKTHEEALTRIRGYFSTNSICKTTKLLNLITAIRQTHCSAGAEVNYAYGCYIQILTKLAEENGVWHWDTEKNKLVIHFKE